MNKKQLIEQRAKLDKARYGRFRTGPFHIFNPCPSNDDEALQHGNALAASGNYPVGTDACFNVGISGGCGPDCFVYLRGDCGEPGEMLEQLEPGELQMHYKLYGGQNGS